MQRRTKTVDLSKFKNVDVKSFTIRETGGEDLTRAAERVVPPDGSTMNEQLWNILLRGQLIAGCIIEVGGKKVIGTCQQWLSWNQRTREFVGRAFNYLNNLTEKEVESFEAALSEGDEEAPDGTPDEPEAT